MQRRDAKFKKFGRKTFYRACTHLKQPAKQEFLEHLNKFHGNKGKAARMNIRTPNDVQIVNGAQRPADNVFEHSLDKGKLPFLFVCLLV